jgi:hypothetical protein
VIVRKFTRDWCAGYASANPTTENPEFELLDSAGKLQTIPWNSVKWVCYVREIPAAHGGSGAESAGPERLLRRKFTSRPRIPGLWLKITLTDGDELEGMAANDRSLVEGAGLLVTPPDTRSNTQRVFVPRSSIRELAVLAVIGSAAPSQSKRAPVAGMQPELFPDEEAAAD